MNVRTQRPHWAALGAAWALFALLFGLWSLATPVSGAPDEPAHLVKAASVVRGAFIGEPGEFGHEVTVPAYIAATHDATCFAFHPERSAGCAGAIPGGAALVESHTTAGLYNPLYYLLVGWPSLVFGDATGIYAMRLASAVLTSGLLAMAFMVVAGWRRRTLPVLGLMIAVTPMLAFLGGVVNPSGPEVAGTLTAVVAALSIILDRDPGRRTQHFVVMAIAAATAVNMRGISPIWVVIGLATSMMLLTGGRLRELLRSRAARVAVAVILAAAVFAIGWTSSSNSLGAALNGDTVPYPGVGATPITGFTRMFFGTFDMARGIVGEFGWLDTPAPAFAYFAWSAFTGGILAFALAVLSGRRRVVVLVLIGSAVLVPAAIQAAYVTAGGFIWQGRYTMPVFVALVATAAVLLDDVVGVPFEERVGSRLLAVVAVTWGFVHFDAFLTVLRRYATGWPSAWDEFFRSPDWAPPGGTVLLPVIALVVCGALASAAHGFGRSSRLPEREVVAA